MMDLAVTTADVLNHSSAVVALTQGIVPNPPAAAPPEIGEKISTFLGWAKWAALVAGVIGLIWCGILMNIGRRNRSATAADGASGIPWVLGGLTVASFAASIVSATVS